MKLSNTSEILLFFIFLCYNVKAEIPFEVKFELAEKDKTVKTDGKVPY